MVDRINLNADMGEGFGAYSIGDDYALVKIIGSANIACGLHGGDPIHMRQLVALAKDEGVSVGAHPGFNDLWGFGRRRIEMDPEDLEYTVAYQIGALQGLATYSGVTLTHVKPHGALNNMAAEDAELAMAIGRAIKTIDRDMIYLALAGSEMERAAEKLGLPVAREGFADRLYEDDGNLMSRKIEGSVVRDPETARRNVVRMVQEQEVVTHSGKRLPQRIDTVCIHGDEPTAVPLARAVRKGLEEAGIRIVPLTEMQCN